MRESIDTSYSSDLRKCKDMDKTKIMTIRREGMGIILSSSTKGCGAKGVLAHRSRRNYGL